MLRTVQQFQHEHPGIQTVISKTDSVNPEIYDQLIQTNDQVHLLESCTYDIMKHSDLLIVASGTATLESALLETPLIIVYKVDPISYFIGKQLIKIDSIGLVNVIAEKKIVPEFIQYQFKKENLIPEMDDLLFNKNLIAKTIQDLKNIKQKLGQPGASKRTAQKVFEMIS